MNYSPIPLHSVIRFGFLLLFLLTLLAGAAIFGFRKQLFAPQPDLPSENSSARTYNVLQVVVVWLHAVVMTGAFAIGWH